MDTNPHQTPGLGLPPPLTPQDNTSPDSGQAMPNEATPIPMNMPVAASSSPGSSDDSGEALDQEWVDKAKDIVEHTKSDPFTESRELNKVKAAYLKTRYNKDIKVHEDGAQ